MSRRDSEFWNKARRARDKLIDKYLDHPDVNLIDIGYSPAKQGISTGEVVLRVHVSEQWFKLPPEERLSLPDQVDGIPVSVISGDYRIGE
jgi:hypothetical protein